MTKADSAEIMIIDDELANLRLLITLLRQEGYNVCGLTDGTNALQAARLQPPDLILLDLNLPELDGLEICTRLKADQQTHEIPVIFISGTDDVSKKVKAFEVGGVDYILKPFQISEVLARVNMHLTLRRLQQNLLEQNQQLQDENLRRLRVQEALRESRARYRLLAEHSTDMITQQNLQGIYHYVSPACQTLLGYTAEEMVGHAAAELFHTDDLKTIQTQFGPIPNWPSSFTITYRARCKDNTYIWLETTYKVIRNPKDNIVVEIIGVSRNVTERVRVQEALANERYLLRTLIDAIPDYIYVKDTESRFILGNAATMRGLGVTTPEQYIGKTDFDFFPPELAAQYYANEREVTRSGQALLEREERVVNSAGQEIWASTTTVPLRDDQERIIGLVGVSRNVTERMQAAEFRPRHRKHLARGVQLHRARAERNHRMHERKILRLEPLDVAEHLVLGVMAVEGGMLEKRTLAR
ncbi:MAG: PAS domain S-box protein, partial [Chloroflexi bacterium]|nr:PAS domain S-box protein [Chloroflexota bacterium]